MKSFLRILIFTACVLAFSNCASYTYSVPPDDDGEFLTWGQRVDLILKGSMVDKDNNLYDIKLAPGYIPIAKTTGELYESSALSFAMYWNEDEFAEKVWDHICESESVACDAFLYFAKLFPETIADNYRTAADISSMPLFGWAIGYPAMTLWSIVETPFLLAAIPTIPLFPAVYGVTLPPAAYLTIPTIASTSLFAGATVFSVAADVYNTLAVPPMALFGGRPNPSRVDGNRVKITWHADLKKSQKNKQNHTERDRQAKESEKRNRALVKQLYKTLSNDMDALEQCLACYADTYTVINEEAKKELQQWSLENEALAANLGHQDYAKLAKNAEFIDFISDLRKNRTPLNLSAIRQNLHIQFMAFAKTKSDDESFLFARYAEVYADAFLADLSAALGRTYSPPKRKSCPDDAFYSPLNPPKLNKDDFFLKGLK